MPGPESAGLTHRRSLYTGGQGGSMGGRRRSAAILAASVVAGVAGCGSGGAGVFHPAGSLSAQPGQAAPAPTAAVQRFGGFTFPAGVSIDFTSPAPADASQRAIVAGYQDYVLSMWAAVLTHGKNTAYSNHAGGNALTFVTREVGRYRSPGRTVRGTIRYSGTKVTNVYFGNGASLSSCVDAAAFHDVNAQTGAKMGPALPARPVRYLETVSEGRRSDGTWFVNRSVTYPASGAQGAMCR
jgi:hypothetical protein